MIHMHFIAASEIWAAFSQGKISVAKRDELLRPLRAALRAYEPQK